MQDSTHSIARSASRFFSGTMLSRITGMLRDMALAYAFGTQSAVAALLVAFRFAHLFRRLFGEGALQTAFIPHFEDLRKKNPARASQFFCDLALSLTAFLTILIIMVMAILWFLPSLIELSPGNLEILWLTELMLPSLLFICLFGINASLLQCEKSYFVPSAAPVAFNLIWIVSIFSVASLPAASAMSWLAGFVVLACFAQWAITLPKTIQLLKTQQLFNLWKQTKYFSIDVRQLYRPLLLGIIGVAASQINNALDAVFARWADEEGPAFLWYAIRLQQLPLALFGIALSGALLPPLSRALKNHDMGKYQHFLNFALKSTVYLMTAISIGLFAMGDSCVNLIYGRGDFNSFSVTETTYSLWGYTLGLIPMSLILILAPAFYAKNDYRTPSMAAVGSMIVNVILNGMLVVFFGLGAASIAFATSVSAWLNFIWLGHMFSKDQGMLSSGKLLPGFGKISVVAIAAGICSILVDFGFWGHSTVVDMVMGREPVYTQGVWLQLSHLAIGGGIFLMVLLMGCLKELKNLRKVREIKV